MSKPIVSVLFLGIWVLEGQPGLAAPGGPLPAEVEQVWSRLAAVCDPFNPSALQERTDELVQVANRLELKRLTPYAQALVLCARPLPLPAKEAVLRQALRLDPSSPEVLFELASLQLKQFSVVGVWTTLRAFAAYATDGRLVNFRRGTFLLFLVLVVGFVGVLWTAASVARVLPRLWHDLLELGAAWKLGANGWVFAAFLLALPLFFALDPLWLAFWLSALAWAYFSVRGKIVSAVFFLFFAAVPTAVEVASRNLTQPLDPITRAAWALREHRYDPLALVELKEASDLFVDDPRFYRLKGDLERQFGLLEASLLSFQEGLRQNPQDPSLLAAAGTVHYLQGNYGAAVPLLLEARERGFDPVVVNFNLSLAFAHLYNFKDSDEAIAAARRVSEARLRQLTRGRDNQVIVQSVSLDEARAILDKKDPLVLLNRGYIPPPVSRERTLLSPLAIGPAIALAIAMLHFLGRSRGGGLASACVRCGRTFCTRCKLSRESKTYCTQCVNIFLKRDMVAPELQIAKHKQLQRRQRLQRLFQRLCDLLLPGFGQALYGRPVLGVAVMVPAAALAVISGVVIPYCIQPLCLHASLISVRVFLFVLWAGLLILAQVQRKTEG